MSLRPVRRSRSRGSSRIRSSPHGRHGRSDQRQRSDRDSCSRLGAASRSAVTTCISRITWASSFDSPTPTTLTGRGRFTNRACLHVRDTAMSRPGPDPKETLDDFYTHVASPEILIDHEQRAHRDVVSRLVDQRRELAGRSGGRARVGAEEAATRSSRRRRCRPTVCSSMPSRRSRGRPTFACFSTTAITTACRGSVGCRARRIRSRASSSARIHFVTGRMRDEFATSRWCCAASRLHVFFTAIGDTPERVMLSTIDLAGDWSTWRASPPIDVLQPETAYECTNLPNAAIGSRRHRRAGSADSRPVRVRGERPRLPVLFDLRRAGHRRRRNHRAHALSPKLLLLSLSIRGRPFDVSVRAAVGAEGADAGDKMKFMVQMNVKKGPYQMEGWSPEDVKRMVGFMNELNKRSEGARVSWWRPRVWCRRKRRASSRRTMTAVRR